MTRTIAILLFVALTAPLSAQIVFERTYSGGPGGDGFAAAVQTADGGYMLAGLSVWNCIYPDAWLVRTDAHGDTMWTRKFGNLDGIDAGHAVLEIADSGFAVAGYVDRAEVRNPDAWLVRTGMDGDTIWTRTYGGSEGDAAYSLARTERGGYILAGYTTSFGAGICDFYLVRTDADGDTLWTRTYGGSDIDIARGVEQVEDGGYIVAGQTKSTGAGGNDFYLVRTDADGDMLWLRTYGGSADDICHAVASTGDNGYVLVGITASYGAGDFDAWLVKTDSLGDTLWTRTYGGEETDLAHSVRQTSDGGYIIAGETWSFGVGESDLWLVRTDANGDTIWTRTYGGADIETGSYVAGTSDGGYAVCGGSASFTAGDADGYLVKTDPAGRAAIEGPRPSVVPEAPSAPTVLGFAELLEELRSNPGSALFDASGRAVINPQSGVVFIRCPDAARKALLVR